MCSGTCNGPDRVLFSIGAGAPHDRSAAGRVEGADGPESAGTLSHPTVILDAVPTRRTGRTAHEIVTVPPSRTCRAGHPLQHPNVSVGVGEVPGEHRQALGWTCRTCGDTVWDTAEPPAHT